MEALAGLRRSLCTAAHFTQYKNSQVNGQHANTRARALLTKLDSKTRSHADCYRRARRAYIHLNGPGIQEDILQDLRHEHVRAMQDSTDAVDARAGPREGHRIVSWIWSVPGTLEDAQPDIEEGLFIYSILNSDSDIGTTYVHPICRASSGMGKVTSTFTTME